MALYKIKEDCRIANKNYSKWDVVSNEEVGWYFPTVMEVIDWKVEKKVEVNQENSDDVEDKKPSKKWKRK